MIGSKNSFGKVLIQQDCNRCDVGTSCKGMRKPQGQCGRFVHPVSHNKLVEIAAMEHPTSFNQAMSNLPKGVTFQLKWYAKYL